MRIILTESDRSKEDNSDDSYFYSQPRFAYHLDEGFRSRLEKLYRQYIPDNSIVLDLMSSWVSHLPENVRYKKVLGHGMNQAELSKNLILDSFWVQNLNINRKLPLDDSSIDICIMAAAWQYLQYPEEIGSELRRIIRKQGLLIVSFSNRAFWTKTPMIWKENSDSGRINYIKTVLKACGWNEFDIVFENHENSFLQTLTGQTRDPFFSIIAKD